MTDLKPNIVARQLDMGPNKKITTGSGTWSASPLNDTKEQRASTSKAPPLNPRGTPIKKKPLEKQLTAPSLNLKGTPLKTKPQERIQSAPSLNSKGTPLKNNPTEKEQSPPTNNSTPSVELKSTPPLMEKENKPKTPSEETNNAQSGATIPSPPTQDKLLGVKEQMARNMASTGKLPPVKVSNAEGINIVQLHADFYRQHEPYSLTTHLIKGGVSTSFSRPLDLINYMRFLTSRGIQGTLLDTYRLNKYVIRGIPAYTECQVVDYHLQNFDIRAHSIRQMTSPMGKKYPMFLVTVPEGEESETLERTTELCYVQVTVEPFILRRGPPQCNRCQQFYHGAEMCMNAPRCRVCAEPHLERHCKHHKDADPKCCNCEGNHRADSQSCQVVIEAKRIRAKNPRKRPKINEAAPPTIIDTPSTSMESAEAIQPADAQAPSTTAGQKTDTPSTSMEAVVAKKPKDAQAHSATAGPSTSTTKNGNPIVGKTEKPYSEVRKMLKKMEFESNGITYAKAVTKNTTEENKKNTQNAVVPIVITETMTPANAEPSPPVNPPANITADGGSTGLLTMVTVLLKAMCPNPTVHNILDAFVAAVNCYYGNQGPNALLDAINVFIGRVKSV